MRGPRRGMAVLVACLLLSACAEGSGGTARRPTTPATSSPVPAKGTGVRLFPAPRRLVDACREAGRRVPILCPSRLPRRGVEPPSPFVSQQLPFGRGLHGVELGYSAPYDDAPRKNRPDRFLHFVVVARTGTASYGSPEEWEPLGRRAFGRRRGSLFYVPVEGVHYQHYLFMWREGGVEYQASLHSWDDAEGAVELLGALVSGLVPPADLGSSTAP